MRAFVKRNMSYRVGSLIEIEGAKTRETEKERREKKCRKSATLSHFKQYTY